MLLVPSTFHPGETSPFWVSVRSSVPLPGPEAVASPHARPKDVRSSPCGGSGYPKKRCSDYCAEQDSRTAVYSPPATYTTVASPASFNNRLGLSRAVNDKLVPGTEIFVAEMGIFGAGEIRELSTHFPPDIAAITVIGEAHLQRMRTTDTTRNLPSGWRAKLGWLEGVPTGRSMVTISGLSNAGPR